MVEMNYDVQNDTRDVKIDITDNEFEFKTDSDDFMLQFTGTFASTNEASGILNARTSQCGSVETTWTASK